MKVWHRALRPGPEGRRLGRLLGLGSLVGLAAGIAAVVTVFLVDFAGQNALEPLTGISATGRGVEGPRVASWPSGGRWLALLLPTLGGLICGWICARFAPEAMGSGTGSVIDAYHRRGGAMRRRAPWIKTLVSAVSIGSGGSGGIEGPVGYISGGIGSLLGRALKVSAAERRVLLMAGFAAGLGSVFHAPMAASVFAAEVLYKELDLEHEVLVPAIIASTVAYAVYGVVHGWDPLWRVPAVNFSNGLALIPYMVLALALAFCGRLFVFLEHQVKRRIGKNERLPLWVRPALGGLGVGLIGLFVPRAMGVGYGIAQTAIDGSAGFLALSALAVLKMVTCTLSAGSGGSVGLFVPSLIIGGALGGAVAQATHALAPGLHVDTAAFAVVGMAGFLSTAVSAPLSSVIMVSELAGTYRLLVPTLWVATIAWVINRGRGLYPEQAPSRLEAPSHLADMMGAVLRRITVKQAMGGDAPLTVEPDTTLRELVQHFAHTLQGVFPIVDPATGRMSGVVDGRELRRVIGERGIDELLIARDFQVPAMTARPAESLRDVVGRMTASGFDEVVVVDDEDEHKLLGILSRREIVNAYHRRMLQTASETGELAAIVVDPVAADPDLAAAFRRGDLVSVAPRDRDDALRAIVAAAQLPPECDRERLLALLHEREALGSTAVGEGLAIPHPQSDDLAGLRAPRLIIGLLKKPVPWGSETTPVDTVCMLIAPSGAVHLTLLGALARALGDSTLRELLRRRAGRKLVQERLDALQPPRSN